MVQALLPKGQGDLGPKLRSNERFEQASERLAVTPLALEKLANEHFRGTEVIARVAENVNGARFKRVVEPGDQLILEAEVDRARGGIYKYKVRGSVDGETAVEAELMCTMRKIA